MANLMQELKEDYNKLIEFGKKLDSSSLDVKGALELNKHLFMNMKKVFENGTEKEKAEALALFGEIADFFTKQAKKASEKTIFTEKGLLNLSSSPNFFTQDQWKALQEIKAGMASLEAGIKNSIPKVKKTGN